MNGKKARALRKQVYGDYASQDRKYNLILSSDKLQRVTLHADERRKAYQHAKSDRPPVYGGPVKRNRLGKTYSQMVEIWRLRKNEQKISSRKKTQ